MPLFLLSFDNDNNDFPKLQILHKRLSIQPLIIAYSMPMFTSYQDYYTLGGEERRRIEMRMMSICLTRFPNCLVLGEPYI